MKRIALLCFVATAAFGGELWLGTLTPRGLSTNNKGAGADAGFRVPGNVKITAQCRNSDGGSADSFICVNLVTCTAQLGVEITGNQALPTSVGSAVVLADAGTSALVSAFSNQNDNCQVWSRQGNEF